MIKNHIDGLFEFIRRWDQEDPNSISDTTSVSFQKSALGNINIEGSSTCFKANTLTKWQSQFTECLEDGVRDLVESLIQKLNCITYSSCQGHPSLDQLVALRKRNVGIVPRNHIEYENLFKILHILTNKVNNKLQKLQVRVSIVENVITSEGPDWPCIDIFFDAVVNDEDMYFRDLEVVYDEFLTELEYEHHQN